MGFQNNFIAIAKDPDMTWGSAKVLMYLLGVLDFENFIHYSQKHIAEELGMHQSHVSRAMRFLVSKGIVLQSPTVGCIKCYRLNPNYAWRGKIKNIDKCNRDHLKLVSSDQSE